MNRQAFVDFLNDLLAIDPAFAEKVMMTRHDCNEAVADHPEIQVGHDVSGQYQTSALGVINGFFQRIDPSKEFVAAVCEPDADGNRTVARFMILVPWS